MKIHEICFEIYWTHRLLDRHQHGHVQEQPRQEIYQNQMIHILVETEWDINSEVDFRNFSLELDVNHYNIQYNI